MTQFNLRAYIALFFIFAIFSISPNTLEAEIFRFKYREGETYRIVGTISEDVFVNGKKNHHSDIITRSNVRIAQVMGNSGKIEATFKTIDTVTNSDSGVTEVRNMWNDDQTHTNYIRDEFGNYIIDENFYMPTVRNVPVFVSSNINIGNIWSQSAYEVQNFSFWGLNKPFRIPFTARYRFSDVTQGGSQLDIIDVEYDINYNAENAVKRQLTAAQLKSEYPIRITGKSKQRIYWNPEKGEIDHYTDSFEIVIETSIGNKYTFVATAEAWVYYDNVDVKEAVTKAEKTIIETGIENVSVTEDARGFTITLEDIQFEADSAVLAASEKEKLKKIAAILEKYPENDLLVSGHTALAGTAENRKKLSEERAGAVADFLLELGIRHQNQIFTQGLGADKPIAPNTNPKDMARNRRVEITVLTKQ